LNLITARDLEEAKQLWIKEVQNYMIKNGTIDKLKNNLNLCFGEDGIYRCSLRMANSHLPDKTKFPILLTNEHYFSKLLVLQAHKDVGHNGASDTLTELRSEYFIPKGRSFVRKTIYPCTICRKTEGKCYRYPQAPDLPESRLSQICAFHNIGIDYAGPLFVYNVYNNSNDLYKCWIALITCQSSRAIYLDLATDYSGQSCINVLKRFFSRRGIPELVTSDNGSTFTANNVQTFVANNGITWNFNIEAAPWTGGFFERLVQSVKRCLKKLLGKLKVTYEQMITILIEVERIINNRPLIYVSGDLTEEPLTPSHLICGKRLGKNQCSEFNDNIIDASTLVKGTIQHFWNRWHREYLTELRDKQKRSKIRNNVTPIKVGDLVLISDDNNKRIRWRTGRVKELIKSKDDVIRAASITVVNKDNVGILRRPINRLYPFECAAATVEEVNDPVNEIQSPNIKFVSDNDIPVTVSVGSV